LVERLKSVKKTYQLRGNESLDRENDKVSAIKKIKCLEHNEKHPATFSGRKY